MSHALPLSRPVFTILTGLIEERLGIAYSAADIDLVAERLTPRALERGFDSLLDYYYFLRYDPGSEGELALLADSLVVNETYFFREADQLRTLVEEILPVRLERQPVARLWCAACATGEEPLTIAALLRERGILDRVQLVASDVSDRALRAALAASYGKRSLRALTPPLPDWLEACGNAVVARPELVRTIDYRRLNLMDDDSIRALGLFDVIVCRNVLIYFRDKTASEVISRLESALRPNGYLLVGASESLLRFGTSLSCEERGGAFFYRRID